MINKIQHTRQVEVLNKDFTIIFNNYSPKA